jgi:hypothetical protein
LFSNNREGCLKFNFGGKNHHKNVNIKSFLIKPLLMTPLIDFDLNFKPEKRWFLKNFNCEGGKDSSNNGKKVSLLTCMQVTKNISLSYNCR